MSIEIKTIDDVLPHISYENGIVVSKRETFIVVDYVFVNDDTFANPVARECRGLKFDTSGRILARPFHKFFNIGEREAPEDVDWAQPHIVLDKLDGSLVHPCMLEGELVFMTRMGVTEQAAAALQAAASNVLSLCADVLADGKTPMFEFTSPNHRLVVSYQEPQLTLLAVRETVSGSYVTHAELVDLAREYGVPVAKSFGRVEEHKSFIAAGRALKGVEGYVVAFDNGHRLKLKADAYVLRHKALAGVAYEKNLLAWVADEALDDVLPLLNDDVAGHVRDYHDQVMRSVAQHLLQIEALVERMRGADRKDIAMEVQAKVDHRLRGVAFSVLDGKSGRDAMMSVVKRASQSETRLEQFRDLFEVEWSGSGLELKDV